MDVPAFEIDCKCTNCNQTWTKELPAQTEVDAGSQGVWLRCSESAHGANCNCRYEACPTCRLRSQVIVIDRRPLDTGAAA